MEPLTTATGSLRVDPIDEGFMPNLPTRMGFVDVVIVP